jgi:hypothetical protein
MEFAGGCVCGGTRYQVFLMSNRNSFIHPIVLRGILALLFFRASCLTAEDVAPRATEQDQQAVIALENEWLASEHNPEVLERILAPDFRHAVVTGDFLTKAEHISWSTKHPPSANLKSRFEKLEVRIYGDAAIASGIVATSDGDKNTSRTIFTDIFAYRGGRWQAVHAQETRVEQLSPVK